MPDARRSFRAGVSLPLALIATFAASATTALACSCVEWRTPQEQLAEMDLAVVARAGWTRPEVGGRGPYDGVTLFTVERTLKGERRTEWKIAHIVDDDGATCGVRFRPGQRVILLARMQDGRLFTSLCHRARFSVSAYERALARGR
jgi:hypothetical protein